MPAPFWEQPFSGEWWDANMGNLDRALYPWAGRSAETILEDIADMKLRGEEIPEMYRNFDANKYREFLNQGMQWQQRGFAGPDWDPVVEATKYYTSNGLPIPGWLQNLQGQKLPAGTMLRPELPSSYSPAEWEAHKKEMNRIWQAQQSMPDVQRQNQVWGARGPESMYDWARAPEGIERPAEYQGMTATPKPGGQFTLAPVPVKKPDGTYSYERQDPWDRQGSGPAPAGASGFPSREGKEVTLPTVTTTGGGEGGAAPQDAVDQFRDPRLRQTIARMVADAAMSNAPAPRDAGPAMPNLQGVPARQGMQMPGAPTTFPTATKEVALPLPTKDDSLPPMPPSASRQMPRQTAMRGLPQLQGAAPRVQNLGGGQNYMYPGRSPQARDANFSTNYGATYQPRNVPPPLPTAPTWIQSLYQRGARRAQIPNGGMMV